MNHTRPMYIRATSIIQNLSPIGPMRTALLTLLAALILPSIAPAQITQYPLVGSIGTCAAGSTCVLGKLKSANFNATSDQAITIAPFTSGSKYMITEIDVANCSVSMTTAQGGVYTAASKGGTIIGATTTPFTNCTGATKRHRLTALTNMDSNTLTAATLYLSLTTAQGVAATADVYIIGMPLN